MHWGEAEKGQILELLKAGFKLIPLASPSMGGKRPLISGWQSRPIPKKEEVLNWPISFPDCNIGIVTGGAFFVLDVDYKNEGILSLDMLIDKHGPLPRTVTTKTGGGGFHFYFKNPGYPIPNCVGLFRGIDIRGEAGQVVAPPSLHETMTPYLWLDKYAPMADAPQWLLESLRKQLSKPISNETIGASTFQKGTRNHRLASIAGKLINKGMSFDEALFFLHSVNLARCEPPVSFSEVKQILYSISTAHERRGGMPFAKYKEEAKRLGQELGIGALKDRPLEKKEELQDGQQPTVCDTKATEIRATLPKFLQNLCKPKADNNLKPEPTQEPESLPDRPACSNRLGDGGTDTPRYDGPVQESDDSEPVLPTRHRKLLELARRRGQKDLETNT